MKAVATTISQGWNQAKTRTAMKAQSLELEVVEEGQVVVMVSLMHVSMGPGSWLA